MRRVVVRILVVAACLLGASAWVTATHHRGADSSRTALAIQKATSFGFGGGVLLHVECADHVTVERRPDPAGSGLEQITVWGRPRVGRCLPDVRIGFGVGPRVDADHPAGPIKFVDGASSQVVTVSSDR